MRRKKFMGDYITHITRYPTRVDMQHLISLSIIEDEMEKMQEMIGENYLKSTEIEKLEAMAEIKMAYIMLYEAYKKKYPGKAVDENEMFEKQDVIDVAHQIEAKADEDYEKVQKLKSQNPRGLNEYNDLRVVKRAPIEEIDKTYKRRLKALNEELERKIKTRNFSQADIIRSKSLLMVMEDAHKNLSNPEYKLRLDEVMLLNFSPDQSEKYIPENFAEITYIPEKKYIEGESGTLHEPEFIAHDSAGDEMIITQTGDLGFGRFRKEDGDVTYRDPYSLKEYKIIKKYNDPEIAKIRKTKSTRAGSQTKWNDEQDGEEFVVYGNIGTNILTRPDVDTEYIRYTTDVLLSSVNMDVALEHNGGYIGEVYVDRATREYVVHHDSDKLCLAKEFQKHTKEKQDGRPLRIKLDKPRKRITPEER